MYRLASLLLDACLAQNQPWTKLKLLILPSLSLNKSDILEIITATAD